jgi:predicted anti-sigma-YlaC factor YlaD
VPAPTSAEYVSVIVEVAARDPSIARVLREICRLDGAVRSSALDLVAAHLRARDTARDVLDCVAALRQDEIADRIAEALGPPG